MLGCRLVGMSLTFNVGWGTYDIKRNNGKADRNCGDSYDWGGKDGDWRVVVGTMEKGYFF